MRGRMRAGGENGEPVPACYLRDRPAQLAQFSARFRHADMRRRNHLDLGLQEFRCDPAIGRGLGGFEKCRCHVAGDLLGLRVDQEIFLFDAECEFAAHSRHSLVLARGSAVPGER